jgi:hypothetical protein
MAISQSRNIAKRDFQGAMGVSFTMRKRRGTGKDSANRGQRSRAASSSFLYFERDSHGPDIHNRMGTRRVHGAAHMLQGRTIKPMLCLTAHFGRCFVCGAAQREYEADGMV